MSPVTHFFSGWVLANCAKLNRKDRALVTLACVIPDIDGLGIIPEILTRNSSHPLLWFSLSPPSLPNLAFALIVTAAAFVLATRKGPTRVRVLLSFHIQRGEERRRAPSPDGDQAPIPDRAPGATARQRT